MSTDLARTSLTDALRMFRNYKALGDRALAQVDDAHLHKLIDADANSIAIIAKHVAGNLRSRFTDFLTTDGEKPDRNRDAEFEMPETLSRDALIRLWESGWAVALGAIETLGPDDLESSVYIRREEFRVVEALNRAVTHIAYHVGQMVLLAKHFAGPAWQSLSIPKGQSAAFSQGRYKQGILRR